QSPLHCGLLSGLNGTFFFITTTTMTWNEAQTYCRVHHTDLAIVRNMTENQKIKDLVPSGQTVWIGLFRDSWKWSDGSKFSFSYWKQNLSDSNYWEDWNCDEKRAFICYSHGEKCNYHIFLF
uniref:C-type lectin domain-containing protein n=1 Tax=Monopterus albus TaxID=43700 RepID=A0A3Q3IY29_MONAL